MAWTVEARRRRKGLGSNFWLGFHHHDRHKEKSHTTLSRLFHLICGASARCVPTCHAL